MDLTVCVCVCVFNVVFFFFKYPNSEAGCNCVFEQCYKVKLLPILFIIIIIMKKSVFRVREALTGVLDLHVGERLQRVLKGDVVKVKGSDAVVHLLGVGNELLGELLDLLGVQIPSQPVLRADRHRAAKHHLT